MKNTMKTAIVTASVAASVIGVNPVKVFAEDPSDNVSQAQNVLNQASETVSSAKQTLDTASAALNSANAEVDRLTAAKNTADQKLSEAQNNLTNAQNELDQVKAKADSITQEDLDAAQNKVNDATNAVNTAQSEADTAKASLDQANQKVTDAAAKVNTAQNAYNSAVSAETVAKQALDTAKAEETQKEAEASRAEEERKAAEEASRTAEENAKKVSQEHPDAEHKAADAKADADAKDQKTAEVQMDTDQAQSEKNTAETEKNNAETSVNSADTDVKHATQNVNDKTAAQETAQNEQNNAQTTLDNANKTLTEETEKAGDAQAKADQEVQDQQAVVDQKKQVKADADKALTEAQTLQAQKQNELNQANQELDAANHSLTNSENELSEKKQALTEAQAELKNANGDVEAKKKAVEDAQKAVDAAQADVDSKTKNVEELKQASANKAEALAKAKNDVDVAQKEKDSAEKALNDMEEGTMYKQIWVSTDPVKKPVPSDKETSFVPDIPEAKGAKVYFTYDYNGWPFVEEKVIYNALNETGSYTPASNEYDYNTGLHPLLASWRDSDGNEHVKHIKLNISKYDIYWNTDDYKNWAKNEVTKIIRPEMTPAEKAQAITDYVYQNYKYRTGISGGYGMLKAGGGDCWASTDMICTLGEAAGFIAQGHEDNYVAGNGNGHMNAWLYSPESGEYYQCEAGYDEADRGTGKGHGETYTVKGSDFVLDKTAAKYVDGTCIEGGKDIPGVIARFTHYADTEVHVPTDPQYTTLGGRDLGYFSDGPFSGYTNLKTVYIGNNIKEIRENAYTHTENSSAANGYSSGKYNNSYKFVVAYDNPVYCSDENGSLYKKNADGSRGELLYTPGDRNEGISDDEYYASLSKTNLQYDNDYLAANVRVKNADEAYNAATTKYTSLQNDDFTKAITSAQKTQEASERLLNAANTRKRNADQALNLANTRVTNASAAIEKAQEAVNLADQKVTEAQTQVESAKKPVEKAKTALNSAENTVAEKQKIADDAQKEVNAADKVLTEKKEAARAGAPQSLLKARKAVEDARNDLEAKKQALTDAQNDLVNAKKDLTDKQNTLAKAKEVLVTKQNNLRTAEAKLTEKQNMLAEARQASDAAHAVLNQANAEYQKVLNAESERTSATEALKQAESKVASAQEALEQARKAVPVKTTELNEASEKVQKLAEDLGLVKNDLEAVQLNADQAKKLFDEKSAVLSESKSDQAKAQAELDDLVNTIQRRDELEGEITDLNDAIDGYQNNISDLNQSLESAKQNASVAEKNYQTADQTYQNLVEQQKLSEQKNNYIITVTQPETEKEDNEVSAVKNVRSSESGKQNNVIDHAKKKTENSVVKKTVEKVSDGYPVTVKKNKVSGKKKTDSLNEKKEEQTFDHLINVFQSVSEPVKKQGSAPAVKKNVPVTKQNEKKTGTVKEVTEDQKTSESAKSEKNSQVKAYVRKTDPKDDASHSVTWIVLGTVSLITAGGAVWMIYRKHAA